MLEKDFQNSGFAIIRKLISASEVKTYYDYAISMRAKGNFDDGQVPGSPSFYQDKKMVNLQKIYLPKLSQAIGMNLRNVFTYHRVYQKEAILRAHKDSERAEISATINLGQEGPIWPLYLLDFEEHVHEVCLEPGDALIYRGNQLMHWRARLLDSDAVVQVMFHCVDARGKYSRVPYYEVTRKIRKQCREWMGVAY